MALLSRKGLTAKQILQDLSCIKLDGDDEFPTEYSRHWENWLADLPKLSYLSVNHCLRPADLGRVSSNQFYHFSDASEVGYGSACFL